jgi:protein gp37
VSTKTAIQWTDHTFNIAWGCTKFSPGCEFCYAEKDANRYGFDVWGPTNDRRLFGEKHWNEPLAWNKAAQKDARPHRVFTSSMADVYENHPQIDAARERLWALIRVTPWLEWQILTKRAERMARLWPADAPPNAWAGVSVESAKYQNRLDWLRRVSARVRFVSFEPLLGPLESPDLTGIHWAIFGGESGPHARPCDIDWIGAGVDACRAQGVAPFVKQLGSRIRWGKNGGDSGSAMLSRAAGGISHPKGGDMSEWPLDLRHREFPGVRA